MFTLTAFGRKYQVSPRVFAFTVPLMLVTILVGLYTIYCVANAIADAVGIHWIFVIVAAAMTILPAKINLNGKEYNSSFIRNKKIQELGHVLFFGVGLILGVNVVATVFILFVFAMKLINFVINK